MHSLFAKYLSNREFVELCSATRFLEKMKAMEVALAKAQAEAGIIPPASAKAIENGLQNVVFNVDTLATDVTKNGIPTIGFLTQCKKAIPKEHAAYLHWGATSQDISDTALVLVLKDVCQKVKTELRLILEAFDRLKIENEGLVMAARTRNQMAVPIPFSQKVDTWTNPLQRSMSRLETLEPEVFCLQLAGADGTLGVLGSKASTVRNAVAKTLQLHSVEGWHSQRDELTALSDVWASIAASLGKFGQDVLTLSQSEVQEVVESDHTGGSSSMPHKSNPVTSEALVALAYFAVDLSASLKRTQFHKNERDGIALCTEWLVWPKLMETVGAVLAHARFIAENMHVRSFQMQENIKAQNGLLYSEKATYLLAPLVGRDRAKTLLSKAAERVIEKNIHLAEALEELLPELDVDWKSELDQQ